MDKEIKKIKSEKKKLWEELLKEDYFLQGTLVEAYLRCGKSNCRCARDEKFKHGPKYYLSFKERGKSKMVYIREGKVEEVQKAIENYKNFKSITTRISEINRKLMQQG